MSTNNTKLANVGGTGGETEFEQAFSSLAYSYLRDKAPRLLDNMIGFQLVERNDDNTKAMGVFGFQIDKQWLYAPVFFLNGDLKGHELLYMKNNDSFVPLKEDWINYIMSRKPHILGETSASKLRDLGGIYPDIRSLSIPPSVGGGKRASDVSWVKPILPLLAAFKTKTASSLYRGVSGSALDQANIVREPLTAAFAGTADAFDLNKVMPTSFELLKCAYDLSQKFPGVKQGMQRFYGSDCFTRWGKELQVKLAEAAPNIMEVKQAKARVLPGSLLLDPGPKPAPIDHVKSGELKLYKATEPVQADAKELDDAERERLLHNGVLIKDERTGEQVSRTYNTQVEVKLTNPSETGIYRVLEKPGEFSKMLVLAHGMSNRGSEAFVTVVRLEGDSKDWLNSHATNVFADQVGDNKDWKDFYDGLSDASDLKEGGEYVAVTENKASSVPFRVMDDLGDDQYKVDFRTYTAWSNDRSRSLPSVQEQRFKDAPSTYNALLCIGKESARGTSIRAIGGELRLPATCKFLKLSDPPKLKDGELMPSCCDSESGSKERPIQLGKIDDIQLFFTEKTSGLRVFNNGTDVYFESALGENRMSVKEAVWHLISVHGLREKTATVILNSARQHESATYRIQYAPGYGTEKQADPHHSVLSGGPDGPIYDDFAEERGVEQYGPRTAVPTQMYGEGAYRLNHMSADQTDPGTWDPWQNYEAQDFQHNVQQAQQASANGQKEVFDTSMMAGMLKTVRQDSLVEKHLGSLVEALDALGRLLMNFYWHQEEFEDRYGKSDLPELEDSLRNSFESLGDITLFLKEKTVESPFDNGEISLEETARN
jgi:hypothetical protein